MNEEIDMDELRAGDLGVTVRLGASEFAPLTCRTEDPVFYRDHSVGLIENIPKAFAEMRVGCRKFLPYVNWLCVIQSQIDAGVTIEDLEGGAYDNCVVEIQVDEIIIKYESGGK